MAQPPPPLLLPLHHAQQCFVESFLHAPNIGDGDGDDDDDDGDTSSSPMHNVISIRIPLNDVCKLIHDRMADAEAPTVAASPPPPPPPLLVFHMLVRDAVEWSRVVRRLCLDSTFHNYDVLRAAVPRPIVVSGASLYVVVAHDLIVVHVHCNVVLVLGLGTDIRTASILKALHTPIYTQWYSVVRDMLTHYAAAALDISAAPELYTAPLSDRRPICSQARGSVEPCAQCKVGRASRRTRATCTECSQLIGERMSMLKMHRAHITHRIGMVRDVCAGVTAAIRAFVAQPFSTMDSNAQLHTAVLHLQARHAALTNMLPRVRTP